MNGAGLASHARLGPRTRFPPHAGFSVHGAHSSQSRIALHLAPTLAKVDIACSTEPKLVEPGAMGTGASMWVDPGLALHGISIRGQMMWFHGLDAACRPDL